MQLNLRDTIDDAAFAIEMVSRLAAEWLSTGIVFNPMRSELRVDPYPFYRALREKDPIHRSYPAGGWILTRYEDIAAVLGDRNFSSDERNWNRFERLSGRNRRAGLPDLYEAGIVSMLRIDPPDHTRLRSLVAKAFTPRAVERMRPRVQGLVDELAVELCRRTSFDLMRDFASPLPVVIIAEMLGVDVADRARFRSWSNEAIALLGDSTREERRRAVVALEEMRDWLEVQIEDRRRSPREDLLSGMVAAEESGDRLSTNELFATCLLLLVAGNETTTNLIGNGMIALLRHPDQLALLRREPERVPAAVEELLRYDSPVQLTSRIVLRDTLFRGHAFRCGQQIVLVIGAGNRDPDRFPDPDRLDVCREDVRPLSFGHGLHYCLGAQLARLEAQIALEALLTRLPELRFGGEIEWGRNTVLRGPRALPLAV